MTPPEIAREIERTRAKLEHAHPARGASALRKKIRKLERKMEGVK